mmetsp:Transcript_2762/g.8502  ORF Transcript_2762/g.8502 Transcript_2762/m.8502 type:complete len:223 (-) Transcript_2762:882-1550(-)
MWRRRRRHWRMCNSVGRARAVLTRRMSWSRSRPLAYGICGRILSVAVLANAAACLVGARHLARRVWLPALLARKGATNIAAGNGVRIVARRLSFPARPCPPLGTGQERGGKGGERLWRRSGLLASSSRSIHVLFLLQTVTSGLGGLGLSSCLSAGLSALHAGRRCRLGAPLLLKGPISAEGYRGYTRRLRCRVPRLAELGADGVEAAKRLKPLVLVDVANGP